ncbi:Testis-specific serine/threonine-protein kinase 5 [Amphibalanus amphitrite]|uniref:Testis-specific serine/threonine-protein kinase 5 n=1 Tax=Amphibalanus amphitrite TaxID=1232801 RepID=A0A6A4WT70_AMPAM|nr:Testis-specific serine/threonine-protein kinase 5 [Amphibalanus amphitrite]
MADGGPSEWDSDAAALKQLQIPFALRLKGEDAFRPDRRRREALQQEGITLFETIAEGSFSKIRRAYFQREHKEVVVKVISKQRAPDEYYSKFLPRELATLRLTQEHPLVVDLYAAYEGPAAYYLVMEYCERGDLLDYVNKMGYLNEVEARAFFRQMVDAVQYLHHMGIVHRDVKLENMLLNADYEIRIADFGFARFHGEQLSETKCGSFVYTAPEIFYGHPYNAVCADLWSLGVCLYAMVCGRLPLAQTRADLRDPHALLTAAHRKVHFTKPVTADCRDTTRRLLSPAPERRPTTAELKQCAWMCRPLAADGSDAALGASWSSHSSLRRRPSALSAAAAGEPQLPGAVCEQRHGAFQPTRPVGRVLRALASGRARGLSRRELLGGRPGAVTGVAGPVGRQLSLLVLHEQHGAGRGAALRRSTSNSMVLLPSEVVMQAAQSRTALTVRSDLQMLKHSMGGQAARAAKQEGRSAKKKGSAKYTSAKMRWKAAVLAMKRQRFNRWRDLCQKLGKLPHMRIEDAEQELDLEQNFDFSQF